MGKGFGLLRKTCQSVVANPQQHSALEEEKNMKRKRVLSRELCSAWDRPHGQQSPHPLLSLCRNAQWLSALSALEAELSTLVFVCLKKAPC